MVEVRYSHRLVCDSDFLHWLVEQKDREAILSHLIHIKSTSHFHKKQHNLILDSEVSNCSGNHKINEKYLGAAFKKVSDPEFLTIYKDQVTKNIIFAIDLADEPPYRCYILTSPEKEQLYKQSKHLKDVVSVQPISGEIARKIIYNFFTAFTLEREKRLMGLQEFDSV